MIGTGTDPRYWRRISISGHWPLPARATPRCSASHPRYHSVLASRALALPGRPLRPPPPDAAALTREAHPAVPRAHAWAWAPALMHRTLDLAVLAWPRYGGRLRIVATIQDPAPRARL